MTYKVIKWVINSMDFIIRLLHTYRQHDLIWVIVDQVTKSTQFLPIKIIDIVEDYSMMYIVDIVKIYEIPFSIILYKGAQCTTHFYKSFHKGLGKRVNLCTIFHI